MAEYTQAANLHRMATIRRLLEIWNTNRMSKLLLLDSTASRRLSSTQKVTTDMFENLVVSSWVGIRANCDMTYCINTDDDIDFMLSDGARRFDFAIETQALRQLLEVGSRALTELDTRRAAKTAKPAVAPQERAEATA